MSVLVVLWSTFSFSYYMTNIYLKYLSGSIYLNAITISIAEIIAKLSSSYILLKIGLKHLNSVAYILSGIGALSIIFFPDSGNFTAIFILCTRFGVCMAIVGAYVGVILLMPT